MMIETLKEENTWSRRFAVEVLGAIGPAASPAISALLTALDDPSDYVRVKTLESLIAIGPEAYPQLMQALAEKPQLRKDAPRRGHQQESIPFLVQALSHDDPVLRAFAAEQLGALGSRADSALPALKKALADESPEVRRAAEVALRRVEQTTAPEPKSPASTPLEIHAPANRAVPAVGPPKGLQDKTGPLAHFRFNGNAENECQGDAQFELRNTEFRGDALYLNGKYDLDNKSGSRAVCSTPTFDYTAFTVAIRLKAEEFRPGRSNIITGGAHDRWFGMEISRSGNLTITFNNQRVMREIKQCPVVAGQWIALVCSVDLAARRFAVYADGRNVAQVELPEGFRLEVAESKWDTSSKSWSFANYGNANVYHGLVDELILYNRLLSPEEVGRIPWNVAEVAVPAGPQGEAKWRKSPQNETPEPPLPPEEARIDPKVDHILRQMTDFYRSVKTASVEITTEYEGEFGPQGPDLLTKSAVFSVAAQRPDCYAVRILNGKSPLQWIISNGTKTASYSEHFGGYRVEDQPLDRSTRFVEFKGVAALGEEFLFDRDLYRSIMKPIKRSQYVGLEKTKEGESHHLKFFEENDTFVGRTGMTWDLWLRAGSQPLVGRVVAVPLEKHLKHTEPPIIFLTLEKITRTFSKWKINPNLPKEIFSIPPTPNRESTGRKAEG